MQMRPGQNVQIHEVCSGFLHSYAEKVYNKTIRYRQIVKEGSAFLAATYNQICACTAWKMRKSRDLSVPACSRADALGHSDGRRRDIRRDPAGNGADCGCRCRLGSQQTPECGESCPCIPAAGKIPLSGRSPDASGDRIRPAGDAAELSAVCGSCDELPCPVGSMRSRLPWTERHSA